jgi:hypothetical protein
LIGLKLLEVATLDMAAGQGKLGALGVERNVRHREVVGDAAPIVVQSA